MSRDETAGHGADIVYNTVGSPYFAAANAAMAHGGRQIFIATIERPVPFDIFAFYRGRHSYFGIDSLALDASDSAALLRKLLPGLANGQLQPLPVKDALLCIGAVQRCVSDGACHHANRSSCSCHRQARPPGPTCCVA